MKNNSEDIQTTYYTFVSIWLLSFEKIALPFFIDPVVSKILMNNIFKHNLQLGLIRNMIICIQKLSRDKIIRVGYSVFQVYNLLFNED